MKFISDSNLPAKKKIKVSRNKKKSWRKHTNIEELEGFLNEKRFEERIGHSITEAKDEDLFVIEKTGDDNFYQQSLEKFEKKITPPVSVPKDGEKLRRIALSSKILKRLESTSKVPPITIQKGNSDKRKTIFNDDEKLIKYYNERKSALDKAKKEKEEKLNARKDENSRFNNNFDLWAEDSSEKPTVKVPVHLRQKPSLLPAVEVPLPGQSYNPSPEDHYSLLQSELEKELRFIKQEKELADKVDKFFVTKSEAMNPKNWLDEMSQGLFDDPDDDAEGNDHEIDPEDQPILKLSKPKTKQQKRRELKEKLVQKEKEMEKNLRLKENDVFRIKTIQKELNQREERLKERARIRQAKKIESLYRPKRLSRFRYEEGATEITLPSELPGSLRKLKPAIKIGNSVLRDRFKSLQRRNIIETRVKQFKRLKKFKIKREIKRRHRDNPVIKEEN